MITNDLIACLMYWLQFFQGRIGSNTSQLWKSDAWEASPNIASFH
jgi:hypothetical protein